MVRGGARVWDLLPDEEACVTMLEAKVKLKALNVGSNQLWKRAPSPGDGKTFYQLRCAQHVDCGLLVKTKFDKKDGLFYFWKSGDHTEEMADRVRSNGIMSAEQAVAVRVAMRANTAPAQVRTAMTLQKEEELKKLGIDPLSTKKKEGGLEGEMSSK